MLFVLNIKGTLSKCFTTSLEWTNIYNEFASSVCTIHDAPVTTKLVSLMYQFLWARIRKNQHCRVLQVILFLDYVIAILGEVYGQVRISNSLRLLIYVWDCRKFEALSQHSRAPAPFQFKKPILSKSWLPKYSRWSGLPWISACFLWAEIGCN